MIKRLTSEEDRAKLREFLITLNIATCKCGNMMEVVQGEIDQNLKDENGKPLSEEAAVHWSLYRIRCNNCNTVFCSSCKAEPYHLGYTCV